MTETKIFWLTNKVTDETYEPNYSKLVEDITSTGEYSREQVETMISELEPEECILFIHNGVHYELEVEFIEEDESEDPSDEESKI